MSAHQPAAAAHSDDEFHDDIIYPATIPFVLVHLACFAAFWTGVTVNALIVCMVLYVVRMFGITAGYHRYFSHRSFKTSRAGQFVLAWIAQSSAQRGALWWAAVHRHHHRHSDTEMDVHSPRMRGFLYSHVGWIFDRKHAETEMDAVPDLAKHRELVLLERYPLIPAIVLAVGCFVFGGWTGLVVGFFWSTVLLFHGTFFINSLAHVTGSQRYVTGDDSRNNWWLAIITLGEGWHNNHHAYQRSTRQGFRWYEFDPTFYALRALSWVGLVWELGEPPAEVVNNERKLGAAVVEKVARQLAASFPIDGIAAQAHAALAHAPHLEDLRAALRSAQSQAATAMAAMHLPHVPSVDEVRQYAERTLARTPSMDQIAERARHLVVEAVCARLAERLSPA
ncbi:acyl-CoA desaturase [Longimicrobium terrae]|uniref:Stearoyl-CoA desaturase (Delta-9 desaturase) n=1 Tax=Longimicrobium terrae TaxID=1639882 RepID=A0A841H705_9BACT|nr:fatty acid desaturase [Longimicrobium terrae]MBB4639515.1 stearoyl-CoA desaturase (delta-9 desaturase) [Longimicrobium terrae]MBB6073887.1 stearoyl-CoA desaturase (delta-9 desaturase) [Longimicrobium terrae]NNC32495.1 acyl-CoA desaturase [Longimicrobium terrae]